VCQIAVFLREEGGGYYVTKVKGYELWYPVEPYKVQVNYSTKVIQAIEDG
jgi:hypothetical protein